MENTNCLGDPKRFNGSVMDIVSAVIEANQATFLWGGQEPLLVPNERSRTSAQ